MNNRGQHEIDILTPETLKIIVAIICLIILGIFGAYMYTVFKDKTQTEQAKASLEQLLLRANQLKDGQQEEFLYTAPKDWYIKSVVYDGIKVCKFQYCLCFCKSSECDDNNVVCRETYKFFKLMGSENSLLENEKLNAPVTFILQNKSEDFYVLKKGVK